VKFQKQRTSGHNKDTPRGDISSGGTHTPVKMWLLPLMTSKRRQIWQSSKKMCYPVLKNAGLLFAV